MDWASKASREVFCTKRSSEILGRLNVGAPNLSPWGKPSAAVRDWCCCHGRHAIASWSTSGRPTSHTLAGGTPILALDMYEHSYHMDFGAKAASYVDCFMEVIRWQNAERQFKALSNSSST